MLAVFELLGGLAEFRRLNPGTFGGMTGDDIYELAKKNQELVPDSGDLRVLALFADTMGDEGRRLQIRTTGEFRVKVFAAANEVSLDASTFTRLALLEKLALGYSGTFRQQPSPSEDGWELKGSHLRLRASERLRACVEEKAGPDGITQFLTQALEEKMERDGDQAAVERFRAAAMERGGVG